MLKKNLILKIIFSHLLLSGCQTKLIENESFLRNSNILKTINNDPKTVTQTIQFKSLDTNIELKSFESTEASVNRDGNSESLFVFNWPSHNNSSTDKTKVQLTNQRKNLSKKIERKIDTIDGQKKQQPEKSQQFFYVQPQNQTNFYLNRTSKYYINYRQAYGIRYDPNKIRRSFNFEPNSNDFSEANENSIEIETQLPDITQMTSTIETDTKYFNDYIDPSNVTEEFTENTIQSSTSITKYEPIDTLIDTANIDLLTTTTTPPYDEYNIDETQLIQMTNKPSQTTNIMKPSRVQAALQFFNSRVKQLLTYGLTPTAPAKISPPSNGNNGQRFLNLFNVIKFQNIPCASDKAPLTRLNGTCYHKFECDQLGGVAVDECAGGFGVCCVCKYFCCNL